MVEVLKLIGRDKELFDEDLQRLETEFSKLISGSSFLIIGAAGSIGQAVTKEIFKRNPKKLHLVDINENNLVELIRDIRSSYGYIDGEFKTFCLDIGSSIYNSFIESDGDYDYILNLSAMKHVRSEKDPFTLMRMIETNIENTEKTLIQSIHHKSKKYFCVSTDKAANPVNMMGASKRIMEMFLARRSSSISISTARFANVAFSDGSLLYGFNERIKKRQPIAAPNDVKRYFLTSKESGELCLLSCILGDNLDIFFPKLNERLNLITFSEIAEKYLINLGYEPFQCDSEEEARERVAELVKLKKWPCYFFKSDTTGEKDFEEFFTKNEILNMNKFLNVGIIQKSLYHDEEKLLKFENEITKLKESGHWNKEEIVDLFHFLIPDFGHKETGKYLDGRM